jgi:hypothetical protein
MGAGPGARADAGGCAGDPALIIPFPRSGEAVTRANIPSPAQRGRVGLARSAGGWGRDRPQAPAVDGNTAPAGPLTR